MTGAKVLLLGLATLGCASRQTLFSDATIEYPQPAAESCAGNPSAPYLLLVTIKDAAGGLFPHEPVYVLPPDNDGRVLLQKTDQSGTATLSVPAGNRTVLVAAPGFEPEARTLALKAGCTGSATLLLRLAPMRGGGR